MKNVKAIKEYRSIASAKKAIAQFKRRNRKVSEVFTHMKHDKRLKASNRLVYAVALFN